MQGVGLFKQPNAQGLEAQATDTTVDTQTKIHIHRLTSLSPFIYFSLFSVCQVAQSLLSLSKLLSGRMTSIFNLRVWALSCFVLSCHGHCNCWFIITSHGNTNTSPEFHCLVGILAFHNIEAHPPHPPTQECSNSFLLLLVWGSNNKSGVTFHSLEVIITSVSTDTCRIAQWKYSPNPAALSCQEGKVQIPSSRPQGSDGEKNGFYSHVLVSGPVCFSYEVTSLYVSQWFEAILKGINWVIV